MSSEPRETTASPAAGEPDAAPTLSASPAAGATEASPRAPWSARIRLLLALLATVTLLPYAWGRTYLILMLTGGAEREYAGLVLVGIATVIALTFRLGLKFPGRTTTRRVAVTVALLWIGVVGGIVVLRAGNLIPPYPVAAAFVLATAWLVWCAWMFYVPLRWSTRAAVLAGLLLLIVPFHLFYRVDGLTGAAQVDFNYRNAPSRHDAEPDGSTALAAERIQVDSRGENEFTQFGGPRRNAVLSGVKLERDWKANPPRQLWHAEVGAGWSGFVVSGDAAITQEQRGASECVVCRHLLTGDEAWVHADAALYDNPMGGTGPRATPAVADGRVYAIGALGDLNCIEGSTGKLVWHVNILEDHQAKNVYHGVCGSPLVVGDAVIVCPTGDDGRSLAAYSRSDGTRLWSQGKARASYSSPLLCELAGVEVILLYNSDGLAAHAPGDGTVLWSYTWHNTQHISASQPVLIPGAPDQVLVTTGYAKGSTLLRVGLGSSGAWNDPQPLWDARTMKTKFTTAVAHGGHVFGLDDGILQCIDLQNGKQAWKGGRYGHGQLLLVDDLLLIQSESGDVVLVETNPQKLVELARLPAVSGKTWNYPALAGRYLLSRNDHEAVCYELPLMQQ